MGPNVKGSAIAGVAGAATYLGDIVPWGIEQLTGTMPDRIEAAFAGLTVCVATYLIYRFLPAST